MNVRLLASDLDGTLLNDSGFVSSENCEAIKKMKERGIYFVPASGRCFFELPAEIRDSDLIRYYILSGGATIYDKKEERLILKCLPKQLKDRVLDMIYRYPVCLMAHIEKRSWVDLDQHNAKSYASFNMNDYWVRYALEKERPTRNFKSFIYQADSVGMLVVFFRNPDDLEECRELLKQEKGLLVVQSDPFNLEIVSREAGKGNALLSLAAMLGVDRKETAAVGDSPNDRTMLGEAGLSLAMKNADPDIQSVAHEVICDNNSHCAAYILEHYCSESEV